MARDPLDPDPDSRGARGAPRPLGSWPYAVGLFLWIAYIVLWIAKTPLLVRMPVGIAALAFWLVSALVLRRRRPPPTY
jgi:hypothetical protein